MPQPRSGFLFPVYCLSALVFCLTGGVLGIWSGERLWQYLGIQISFLTVYADMAFALLGLFVGWLIGAMLVMYVEGFLFERWFARLKAEIAAEPATPFPPTAVGGEGRGEGEDDPRA
jgi:hypothetical protein